MKKPTTKLSAAELRRQAEAKLVAQPRAKPQSEAEAQRLLHELQVHQIELEMQNEALLAMSHTNDGLERQVAVRTADLNAALEVAQMANRAKSAFLANMSHELRTPMTAIMGMTGIALRNTTDPKQIDRLQKVMGASQHLLCLINDILDLSKIEAERLTLEQIDFHLSGVLDDILNLLALKAADKDLAFTTEIAPELAQRTLHGDPMRLGQILLNLASNAIKFTATGNVSLRVKLAEETAKDVLLRFEVIDSGIGIAVDDLNRLFSAFEQADSSMTRKFGGTGLGLAISKRLAKLMGGQIGVESAPGQGSTFWFTARLENASGSAVLPAPTIDAGVAELQLKRLHAGARVLLVEDEPVCREIANILLDEVGLVCEQAEDGAAAVAMARRTDYDLILMDIQLPVMNGVDAARAIRALPEREHTPILAMTANAFDVDRQACADAGMNDFITKPVLPDDLFVTLLKWLTPVKPASRCASPSTAPAVRHSIR